MSTFQSTLQGLRKRKYRTIKDFASAYGCSPSKASGILNGKYHLTLSKDEVRLLAHVLGVSFVECADACDNTYAEFKGYKGDAWKHRKRRYQGRFHESLWARWQWQEDLYRDTRKAADSGNWEEYRKKYMHDDYQERRSNTTTRETCFTILGISSLASHEQIKAAFRHKVKLASDGKGGYKGDMDKLVNAKEEALKLVRKQ